MNIRQQFLQHLAPTSFEPLALQISHAKGSYLYDDRGKAYLDLIGGISVCNIGHTHPAVVDAIKKQVDQYMHIMVYGELIQTPQTQYATALTSVLPSQLQSVYFTNSGTEAVEGAMKLAKRLTGKSRIVACHKSYHGSTQGALSILGDEYFRNAYRPLLPDIAHIHYNNFDDLARIDECTAAVIIEPIQAEGGIIPPDLSWIKALREQCTQVGALLVFDEIQTGFGRTGTLFAFQQLGVVPDILLLGKALGGGLPLGAFISSVENMCALAHQPILGHITTFGGHPVSCAAGLAAWGVVQEILAQDNIEAKRRRFIDQLSHPAIKTIRSKGLMIALELEDFESVKSFIQKALRHPQAIFTDWFLFAPHCIRIVPPLNISMEEIDIACHTINECL